MNLTTIEKLLKQHNLLKEFIHQDKWTYKLPVEDQRITDLSYDSRHVSTNTLFFCKGLGFKEKYLDNAIQEGLEIYISENPYDVEAKLGIIVTDIRKAMAILSMAFYDYPQNKLTLIGYTGTKGKTTAAYFLKHMLDANDHKKIAMLSTMNSTLDGKTFFKSNLTTPESLDLYRMMAEAVSYNMTHFIMEVSSQAYKLDRVYQLMFDIGIFMNISPDHISPIEHPTFDDYYYCKRQLLDHSKRFILNLDTVNVDLLLEEAQERHIPTLTYSRHSHEADYWWEVVEGKSNKFVVDSQNDLLDICGEYELKLMGDFNKDNALASLMASALAGNKKTFAFEGLSNATVPGRMEQLIQKNGSVVYVDYAHNLLSLTSLLEFARQERPDGKLITVIGSPGDKSISRREDFGGVLSQLTDCVILTADDPGHEKPEDIAQEISRYITNTHVTQLFEMDREKAICLALEMANPEDTVILAGKGRDLYQKVNGVDTPYIGDVTIAEKYINNM